MKGLGKLDLGIGSCSLIFSITLDCVVCSHFCLTFSAGDLSDWKVVLTMWLRLWLGEQLKKKSMGKREVSNVEFSFCRSTKLREPFGVSREKWLHFVTELLAAISRGSWVPLYTLVQSKYSWSLKKPKQNKNEKATAPQKHQKTPRKTQQNQTSKNPLSVWQLWMFFCKLAWVRAITVCENISIFTVQTPSKARVWSLAVSLLLPEIWSQVSVLVFFLLSFPVPPARAEGTTCLMIWSLEDGKEGYSRLFCNSSSLAALSQFTVTYMNATSLYLENWATLCKWRIEKQIFWFFYPLHCGAFTKTKGPLNISLEKCGSKHCLPRKTGTGLCFSLT